MTYNFDPEKWQTDQLVLVRSQLAKGEISPTEYDALVLSLEETLDEMWRRLDGSYQIENRPEKQSKRFQENRCQNKNNQKNKNQEDRQCG